MPRSPDQEPLGSLLSTRAGRVGAAFTIVGAEILSPIPIHIGQAAIQEVSNSLKGRPDTTVQAGESSTYNLPIVRAGGSTKIYLLLVSNHDNSAAGVPEGTPPNPATTTATPDARPSVAPTATTIPTSTNTPRPSRTPTPTEITIPTATPDARPSVAPTATTIPTSTNTPRPSRTPTPYRYYY